MPTYSNDPETEAFLKMLRDGYLPPPESEKDAIALHRAGVRLLFGRGILMQAYLPSGWRAIPGEGQQVRHGKLLDEQGRVRGSFFYKEIDTETKGYLRMQCRYTTWCRRPNNDNWCVWDHATGTALFESSGSGQWQLEQAKAWLDEHFPKWQDPWRYWRSWKFWKSKA